MPNDGDGFTADDALFFEKKRWFATLHIAMSFQLIMYANIKTTKRYYLIYILLYEFVTKQQEKRQIN